MTYVDLVSQLRGTKRFFFTGKGGLTRTGGRVTSLSCLPQLWPLLIASLAATENRENGHDDVPVLVL